jgi:hypothetical protein
MGAIELEFEFGLIGSIFTPIDRKLNEVMVRGSGTTKHFDREATSDMKSKNSRYPALQMVESSLGCNRIIFGSKSFP